MTRLHAYPSADPRVTPFLPWPGRQRRLRRAEDVARSLVVRCPRPLPQNADAWLVWGRGIAAAANPRVVTSIEQRWSFRVRPAFTAEFSCQREKADQPCVPLLPLTLSFSAPIARTAAEQIRLVPAAGGAPVRPVFERDREHVAQVRGGGVDGGGGQVSDGKRGGGHGVETVGSNPAL